MDHVAFMKKEWNLIDSILNGTKTIESRWYVQKRSPWNKIKANETVYFKNSGEPVTAKAEVSRVLQFSDLTTDKVNELLTKRHNAIGIPTDKLTKFKGLFKNKKYCILVFIKIPEKVTPFEVDKKGFGLMSAWISVENINSIRL